MIKLTSFKRKLLIELLDGCCESCLRERGTDVFFATGSGEQAGHRLSEYEVDEYLTHLKNGLQSELWKVILLCRVCRAAGK